MIVWDLPLRLFHWAFMICVIGAIASGKAQIWAIHERFGMAIMALVVFRIIWGFIGSPTARFAQFLTGPKAVLVTLRDLLRKKTDDKAGHSPLGGYATMALLLIPLMMAVTGAFSTDDILFDGPFYHFMPDWAGLAGDVHHFGEKLLFLIIALHLGALAYYGVRLRKNLVRAMVTGKRQTPTAQDAKDQDAKDQDAKDQDAKDPEVKGKDAKNKGGEISYQRTLFGVVLMIALVALAQWAILLRPDYF